MIQGFIDSVRGSNRHTTISGATAVIGAVALVLTVVGVESGAGFESNPVVAGIINAGGWGAAGAARGAAVALPLIVAYWARNRGDVLRYLTVPGHGLPAGVYAVNGLKDGVTVLDEPLSVAAAAPELAVAVTAYAVVTLPVVSPGTTRRALSGMRAPSVDREKARAVGLTALYVMSVLAVPLGGMMAASGTASADSGGTEWETSGGDNSQRLIDYSDNGEYVYVWEQSGADGDTHFSKLDATDGSVVWNKTTSNDPSELLVENGVAYVSQDGGLHAYDVSNGKPSSKKWSNGNIAASFGMDFHQGTLYVGDNGGDLWEVDVTDGSVKDHIKNIATDNPATIKAVRYHDGTLWVGYVTDGGSGSNSIEILRHDPSTNETTTIGKSTGEQMDFAPKDGYLYTATDGSGTTIRKISLKDASVVEKTGYSSGMGEDGIQYSDETGRVYVMRDDDTAVSLNDDDLSQVTSWSISPQEGEIEAISGSDGTAQVAVGGLNGVAHRHGPISDKTVQGRVVTQDGAPVSNATVKIVGVNYSASSISSDTDAKELLKNLSEAKPPQWKPSADVKSQFQSANELYPAIHTSDQWGLREKALIGDQNLENPQINVKDGQQVVISVWNPTKESGIVDKLDTDEVQSDLPGAPVESAKTVTIRKLGPKGDVTNEFTIKTDDKVTARGTNFVTKESYKVARTRLSAGFYQISVKGSPVSYTIVVGDPAEIAQNIRSDWNDAAGNPSEHAKYVKDKMQNGPGKTWTVETDANGNFNADVPANYKLVHVTAYKAGGLLNDMSVSNRSIGTLRSEIAAVNYNGTAYYTVGAEKIDPPNRDVTVTVASVPAGTQMTPEKFDDLWDKLRDRLSNKSMTWWTSQVPGVDVNQPTPELREQLNQYQDALEKAQDKNAKYQKLLEKYRQRLAEQQGKDPSEVTVNLDDSADKQELKQELRALKRALADLRSSMDTSSTTSASAKNSTTSLYNYQVTVGQDASDLRASMQKGDVVVTATHGGEEHVVPDEYVTVKDSPMTGSAAVVKVEDYPVPAEDPTVRFEMVGMTGSGDPVKDRSEATKNPQFDGEIPEIRGVSVSSWNPEPGSTVAVELTPADQSKFGGITGVTVRSAGSTWNGTVTSATTADVPVKTEKPHQVDITYTNQNGTAFTTTVPVKPESGTLERPASVMSKPSKTGTYAVTGGEIEGAKIQRAAGTVTVTAFVNKSSGTPNSLHVYPSGSTPADEYGVSVVSERGTAVEEAVAVKVHTADIPADALIYHVSDDGNKEPVTSEPSTYGSMAEGKHGDIITLYTDDGESSVQVVEDPTIIQSAWWFYETNTPDIPVIDAILPMTVLPVGLFARHRGGDAR